MALVATPTAAFADPGNGAEQSDEHSSDQSSQHRTSDEDLTEPQPLSTADDNGTGANTTGPYDSTRDGSASDNGLGDGNATGRPCAGCVGKADNKNPPGQLPGPEDNNNGYECDGNSGIARTNPAHTGCDDVNPTSSPPPPPPPPLSSSPPDDVQGVTLVRPAPDAVLGATVQALPRTGFDSVNLVSFAALMIAGGGFILASRRRLQLHRI